MRILFLVFASVVFLSGCFEKAGVVMKGLTVSTSLESGSLPSAPILDAARNITQSSAVLSWNPGVSKSGALAGSYSLKYGTDSSLSGGVVLPNVTSPYTLTSLASSTTYYFQVIAQNSQGSQPSDISNFTTSISLPGVAGSIVATPSQTSAAISWSPALGASSYSVRVSLNSDLSSPMVTSAAISPQTISGLTANTQYYFVVRSMNAAGNMDSTVSSFMTKPLPPSVPLVGTITPMQTSVTLNWSAGTGGGAAASYDCLYSKNSALTGATTISPATSPLVISGLTAQTLYYFKIVAKNGAGSTSSSISNFTTLTPPANAPTLLPTTGITSTGATLNWSAASGSSPLSYKVRYGLSQTLTSSTTVNSAVSPLALTGLSAGTVYYFEVTANYSASSAAATGSFTTQIAAPGIPTLGGSTPLKNSATVTWSAATSGGPVSSYNLSYGKNASLTGATSVSGVTSPYVINTLTSNTLYYYRITAVNSTGSANSSIGSFTTLMDAPGSPTLSSPSSITQSGAALSWSASVTGGATSSYNLIYGTSSTLVGATTVIGVTSPKNLTGLTSKTTYYYQVVAIGSGGSNASSIGTFVTLAPPLSTPLLGAVSSISTSGASVAWSAGIGGQTALTSFSSTLYPVMTNRCATCHSASGQNGTSAHGSSTASVSMDAMYFVDSLGRPKVDFTTPSNSRLVTKLNEGHQCGTSCSTEVLSAINSWKSGGGVAGTIPSSYVLKYATNSALTSPTSINSAASVQAITGLTPNTTYYYQLVASATGLSSSTSTTGSFKTLNLTASPSPTPTTAGPIDFKTELLMVDRRYVYSVLSDLFSITNDTVSGSIGAQVHALVLERAEFGGACDTYAGVFYGTSQYGVVPVEFPNERCFSGIGVANKPISNPSRYSLTMRACNLLVNDTNSLNAIYSKLFGSTTAGAVTDAYLLNTYQLFYPEEGLSTEVKNSLIAVGSSQSATTNTAKWKLILEALCSSGQWQTLH